MDISTATSFILKKYNLKPNRIQGQNFLISEKVYDEIVNSADINDTDIVLEIGPGLGFLTSKLLAKAKKVIAVEADEKLIPILANLQPLSHHLELINSDILQYDERLLPTNYKLLGNIPYYITGKIIRKFLTTQNRPSLIVFLVQKEVAERICAGAGKHSLLSLAVQYYGTAKIVRRVTSGKFFPRPKVDSAIVKIMVDKVIDKNHEKKFWQLARIGFSSKRKTFIHNLTAGLKMEKSEIKSIFDKLNIKPLARAQELDLEQWQKLTTAFILKEQ